MIPLSLSSYFQKASSSQIQETSSSCNKGSRPEQIIMFTDINHPPLLPLEQNIRAFSFALLTCPS